MLHPPPESQRPRTRRGAGEPRRTGIALIKKDAPLYDEQLATQLTSYDPDGANARLDTLVPKRDSSGYRLDVSGRRLSVIFELDQSRTVFLDSFQLAIPMFKAVDVDVQMRPMDRSLWETRVRQGRDVDACRVKASASCATS